MSTFQVSIQIGDTARQRFETVDALVDTGATFSAAPRELLERLGIKPERRERFRIANGGVTENDVGEARVRLAGKEGSTPVIFNEPGEPALVGAVTLESLLLAVDPVAQRLIPVEGLRVSRYDL
jgi:predicted aspartyl protease